MVLQQGQKIPVWGTAQPHERVQVSFSSQRVKVRADAEGNWKAELQPMKASKTPQSMIIKGEKETITYDNIVVGEVWLCSGQSNMEYIMKRIPQFVPPAKGEDFATLELQKPANEMIRVFLSDRGHTWTSWRVADGESLATTSAAGYFFGKALQDSLDVPVGIISAALGGTRIETWTPVEAYEKSPVFAPQLEANNRRIDGMGPGEWYGKLIAPLVPMFVKGFLWYQGENNCGIRDRQYAEKYKVMVNYWREVFNLLDAPFYSVLLAPHIFSNRLHRGGPPVTAEELPIFREQQRKATTVVPHSEYIVVSDLVDDCNDIHPPNKWDVGTRLARVALAKDYGLEETVWSGPRLSKIEVVADSIVLTFEHCAEGLKTNDNRRLSWFEIAAEDGAFRPALADIRGKNQVVVYHHEIKKPAKVRLGWHETAVLNLINSEGLPVTPFASTP